MIARGDIRWFRFEAPDKRRPVLVFGREEEIASLAQLPVVPISTQARGLPWEIALGTEDGLPSACVLEPEWIRSVDRTLLGPWIATLPPEHWAPLRAGLLTVLGFDVEVA